MSKRFQCKRKFSRLGGARWKWLAGSWSYTWVVLPRSFGSTRRLACPHRDAQLVSHRIPAACRYRQRRDTRCKWLTAGLEPPAYSGWARCCKHAWGQDKSSGGDEHHGLPWEAPSWEPQLGSAGTSTTRHPTRGRSHHLHIRGCAKISSAFSSGCNFPRIFIKR